ncbi:MAG: helix-turn-helix transcriptional regulator [Chloroflexi bacterium]|nr:helix-turn-helix transcriptional regulator [Chloroflexota bacterium]
MNKQLTEDAALDRLVEDAVAPLRITDAAIARFDASIASSASSGVSDVVPLRAEQARRLRAVLRRVCAAKRHKQPCQSALSAEVLTATGGTTGAAHISRRHTDPAAEALSLGALIRQGRERLRLSHAQLAHELHVHRDYVRGLEAGERSPLALGAEGACRVVRLLHLPPPRAAVALEVSMAAFLGGSSQASIGSGAPPTLARVRRGLRDAERRRLLEGTSPPTDDSEAAKAEAAEWRAIIAAVAALPESSAEAPIVAQTKDE